MFQVICPICNQVRIVEAKQKWMEGNQPFEHLCRPCSMRSKIKSEEHRKKLSESVKKAQTEDLLSKKSQFMLQHPEFWKGKLLEGGSEQYWKGRHHTEESKKIISEKIKEINKGEKNEPK